jgi:hypothetical protein
MLKEILMRLPILSSLILSACSSVIPTTALRLNAMSPLQADPAGFAVAVTLPDGLGIEQETALLKFIVTRTDTNETVEDVFVLERLTTENEVFRVAPEDLDSLRAAQVVAREWRAENDDATSGSLSIMIGPCQVADGPSTDAVVSVAIQVSTDGPFLPLVSNGPISAIVEPEQIRAMGRCRSELER